MSHFRDAEHVRYSWEKGGCANSISVRREENVGVPETGSAAEFLIEHYWGYTKRSTSRTDEYKVEHPKWELYDVSTPRIDVDFERTYGPEFGFLRSVEPDSVLLAKGSEIAVYKGEKITG